MMRKSPGYWKDSGNVVSEARAAMKKESWDTLPGADTLKKHGYGSLAKAAKYHGGFAGLRDLLGEESLRYPDGFWKDKNNVVSEAKSAMENGRWDTLPSDELLRKYGYSSLVGASYKYHGGMSGLRALLGQENLIRPRGFWKDPVNVVIEARKVMGENGWETFPSARVLEKQGHSSLCRAAKYHGGMDGLRDLISKSLDQPSEQEQLEVLVGGYDA